MAKTYTKNEAIRIRNEREAKYGTENVGYVVQPLRRGCWVVRRRQRPVHSYVRQQRATRGSR